MVNSVTVVTVMFVFQKECNCILCHPHVHIVDRTPPHLLILRRIICRSVVLDTKC